MASALTSKVGPLPLWGWTGIGVLGVGGILYEKKKKAAAAAAAAQANSQGLDSSNLGTVPISSLTTAAQPMPIQMGDTFVNVSSDSNNNNNNPLGNPAPPSNQPPSPGPGAPVGSKRITGPDQARMLFNQGYDIITAGNTQYYMPTQTLTNKPGMSLNWANSPALVKKLSAQGYKIYTIGGGQYWNPNQMGVKK